MSFICAYSVPISGMLEEALLAPAGNFQVFRAENLLRVIFVAGALLGVLSPSSCHATRGSFARWGQSVDTPASLLQTSVFRRGMDQSSMLVAKCTGDGDLIRQLRYPDWSNDL